MMPDMTDATVQYGLWLRAINRPSDALPNVR
jgi:hypothetical protein